MLNIYQTQPWKIGSTRVPLSFDQESLARIPQELKKALGVDKIAVLTQIHGNDIIECRLEEILFQNHIDIINLGRADGVLISDAKTKPGITSGSIAIGIRTADCLPIIFTSTNKIGLLHAGWRGLGSGIIEHMIERIQHDQEHGAELQVFIGPAAKNCCYEVGPEVLLALNQEGKGAINNLQINSKIDLQEIAASRISNLLAKSPVSLEIDRRCSICDTDFFSYRRNKTILRNMNYIVLHY